MKKRQKMNFRDRDLLFVDLETTGLDMDTHEITEVGILVVNGRNYKVKKEYHALVKPLHIETATEEGLRVGQYSKKRWKEAREPEIVLKEIAGLAPNAMVAGWKVDFDWGFLEKGFKTHKIIHTYDYHLLDVISIAYAQFVNEKHPKTLSLRNVARKLKIKIPDEHDAMTDIKATYEVFLKLMKF
ncbi:3'-5' exonuclease [Patescibacteria group bacterium]